MRFIELRNTLGHVKFYIETHSNSYGRPHLASLVSNVNQDPVTVSSRIKGVDTPPHGPFSKIFLGVKARPPFIRGTISAFGGGVCTSYTPQEKGCCYVGIGSFAYQDNYRSDPKCPICRYSPEKKT